MSLCPSEIEKLEQINKDIHILEELYKDNKNEIEMFNMNCKNECKSNKEKFDVVFEKLEKNENCVKDLKMFKTEQVEKTKGITEDIREIKELNKELKMEFRELKNSNQQFYNTIHNNLTALLTNQLNNQKDLELANKQASSQKEISKSTNTTKIIVQIIAGVATITVAVVGALYAGSVLF